MTPQEYRESLEQELDNIDGDILDLRNKRQELADVLVDMDLLVENYLIEELDYG